MWRWPLLCSLMLLPAHLGQLLLGSKFSSSEQLGSLTNAGPVFTEKVFPCRPCSMSSVAPPQNPKKETPKWLTVNGKYLTCNQLAHICSPVPLKNTQHVKTTMSKRHCGIGMDTHIQWMQESQIKTIINWSKCCRTASFSACWALRTYPKSNLNYIMYTCWLYSACYMFTRKPLTESCAKQYPSSIDNILLIDIPC